MRAEACAAAQRVGLHCESVGTRPELHEAFVWLHLSQYTTSPIPVLMRQEHCKATVPHAVWKHGRARTRVRDNSPTRVMRESAAMPSGDSELREWVVGRRVVTPESLAIAEGRATVLSISLFEALIECGACSEWELCGLRAEQLGLPLVDIQRDSPAQGIARTIPTEIQIELGAVPLRVERGMLVVASASGLDGASLERLRDLTGYRVRAVLAPPSQVKQFLIQETGWLQPPRDATSQRSTPTATVNPRPLSAAIRRLLTEAAEERATDIHLKPEASGLRVRFRIGGRIRSRVSLGLAIGPEDLRSLKASAGLDHARSDTLQEGAVTLLLGDDECRLRVSTYPSTAGEGFYLRFVAGTDRVRPASDLGLSAELQKFVEELPQRETGLVVIAGLQGSGKTTTFYSIVSMLLAAGREVATVEESVESFVPGAVQMEGAAVGSLQALLELEGGVVGVGALRDNDTCNRVVEAARTRLVLVCVDAADGVGGIWRMLQMGAPSDQLAEVFLGAIGQCLAGRVCKACAKPDRLEPAIQWALQRNFGGLSYSHFRRGAGCTLCEMSGLDGSVGIYELVKSHESLRELIRSADPQAEGTAARQRLRRQEAALKNDAFNKAVRGVISLEELARLGLGVPELLQIARRGRDAFNVLRIGRRIGRSKQSGKAAAAQAEPVRKLVPIAPPRPSVAESGRNRAAIAGACGVLAMALMGAIGSTIEAPHPVDSAAVAATQVSPPPIQEDWSKPATRNVRNPVPDIPEMTPADNPRGATAKKPAPGERRPGVVLAARNPATATSGGLFPKAAPFDNIPRGDGEAEQIRAVLEIGSHGDFYVDETIPFRFTVRNSGKAESTLRFAAGVPMEIQVIQGDELIWSSAANRPTALTAPPLTLLPGGDHSEQSTWDQRALDGRKVKPGVYSARGVLYGDSKWNAVTTPKQDFEIFWRPPGARRR